MNCPKILRNDIRHDLIWQGYIDGRGYKLWRHTKTQEFVITTIALTSEVNEDGTYGPSGWQILQVTRMQEILARAAEYKMGLSNWGAF